MLTAFGGCALLGRIPWNGVRNGRFWRLALSAAGGLLVAFPIVLDLHDPARERRPHLRTAPGAALLVRAQRGRAPRHRRGRAVLVRRGLPVRRGVDGRRPARPAVVARHGRARGRGRPDPRRPPLRRLRLGAGPLPVRQPRVGRHRRRPHVLAVRAARLLRARDRHGAGAAAAAGRALARAPECARTARRAGARRRPGRAGPGHARVGDGTDAPLPGGVRPDRAALLHDRLHAVAGGPARLVPADGAAGTARPLRVRGRAVRVDGGRRAARRQPRRADRAREPHGPERLRRAVCPHPLGGRGAGARRDRVPARPGRPRADRAVAAAARRTRPRGTGGRGTSRARGPFTQSDRSHERSVVSGSGRARERTGIRRRRTVLGPRSDTPAMRRGRARTSSPAGAPGAG